MNAKKRKLWQELVDAWNTVTPACHVYLAQEFATAYPKDFFGWIALADGLMNISAFESASKALIRARRLAPKEHLSWCYLKSGKLYREKGDHRRAERWYRKAVSSSESQESSVFLGACLAKQGRFSEALLIHGKAASFDPEKADEALFNLGLIHRAEANFVVALSYFEQAIAIDPEYADAKTARDDIHKLLKIRSSVVRNKRPSRGVRRA
ncbi:MAG: tetratricopeptide repeat protein [bacterium]|nr:tetratricopeptide repeat protein [bacterium]